METLSRICLEEIIRITLMAIIVWVWSSPVKYKAGLCSGRAGRDAIPYQEGSTFETKASRNPGWLLVVRGCDYNNIKTGFHRQRMTFGNPD